MQYTLKELFDNLEITLTELSRRSGISDVTLISIRNGKSARRSTINTLLRTFSELYNTKLTLKNVSGIIIQGKAVGIEEAPVPSVSSTMPYETTVISGPQGSTTATKKGMSSQTSTKKSKDTGLPEGCILATEFGLNHGVKRETFRDHMTKGLGPGLIGTSTDTIPQRDQVDYSERVKPNRPNEKERYLTQDQQKAALEFWQRHHVSFTQCESTPCWCHTFLEESE